MDQFRRILVCVNDPGEPDPALQCAVRLAKTNHARVTLVDVEESDGHFWQSDRLRSELRKAREDRLEQLSAKEFVDLPDVELKAIDGRPAVAISQEVVAGAHDLVIKTSRSDRLASRLFFGITSIRLIRLCPCSVWIVQPEHEKFHQIVAAVDPFAASGDDAELNLTVVKTASSLAQEHSCPLYLVGVIPEIRNSPLVPRAFQEEVRRYRSDTERVAGENMRRTIKDAAVDVQNQRIHCLSGHPGNTIAKFIDERDIDLVVMGTVARSGLSGVRIGSTSERVLHNVKSSVLAIKSEAFTSDPPVGV